MRIALLLVLLWPAMSSAQVVHRCVSKGGAIEYTSQPCKAGQELTKVVAATPEPVRPYRAPIVRQRSTTTTTYQTYTTRGDANDRSVRRQRCANAKVWRDGELSRLGMRRSFDDLRRIDNYVREECKGL